MVCLNCNNTYEGAYCPHCGQSAKTKRLRLIEMVNDFIGSFVGGDNKFLNTSVGLICRPGHLVREFLVGKRARYYNPLQMFVFMLTIYAIISYLLGINTSIFDELGTLNLNEDVEPSKYASVDFILEKLSDLTSDKLYGTLSIVLFSVLPYRWLFRKYRIARPDGQELALNCTEQFYTQVFDSCTNMILSTLMLPLCLIPGSDTVLSSIYYIAASVYTVVLYCQLLGIKWWKSIILNAVAMILTVLFFALTLFLIAIFAGVVEGLSK